VTEGEEFLRSRSGDGGVETFLIGMSEDEGNLHGGLHPGAGAGTARPERSISRSAGPELPLAERAGLGVRELA
jgi:hypothetical protein